MSNTAPQTKINNDIDAEAAKRPPGYYWAHSDDAVTPVFHAGNGRVEVIGEDGVKPLSETIYIALGALIQFPFNSDISLETYDLVAHLTRQRAFSHATFGPGARTDGVCDHIVKELDEIKAQPEDLEEWVDVILLALDGAWRSGYTPGQIAFALKAKQDKNESRTWPDWRAAEPGKAIEHVRTPEDNEETRPA